MFTNEYDTLLDVARKESACLHALGLFDASVALDELVKQRAVLLEALKLLHENFKSQHGILLSLGSPDFVYMDSVAKEAIRIAESVEGEEE